MELHFNSRANKIIKGFLGLNPIKLIVLLGAKNNNCFKECQEVLKRVLEEGYSQLSRGVSALDVVQECLHKIELSGMASAGRGGDRTVEGYIELDAAIIDGEIRELGSGKVRGPRFAAVIGCSVFKNPIDLARTVMEYSPHPVMTGKGLEHYSLYPEIPKSAPKELQVKTTRFSRKLKKFKWVDDTYFRPFGFDWKTKPTPHGSETIGAVALDISGNIAAGSSTGGKKNKLHGRVSAACSPGCDLYANNLTCGVVFTGDGERVFQTVSCFNIHSRVRYLNLSLKEAVDSEMKEFLAAPGTYGGFIALDKNGNHYAVHSTSQMPWGVVGSPGGKISMGGF